MLSLPREVTTPASMPVTSTLSSTASVYISQPSLSTFDSNRYESNPHPSQFTTYADASNHFYTSLDRTVLEKPLQHPSQILVAAVVPPSAPPKRLLTSEPHSPDRPK